MNDPMAAIQESTDYPILLVDDDSQIHDLLTQLAKSEFPQSSFIYSTSYDETITYLQQLSGWAPRLIILDIDLKQNKSGLDILSWIRTNEKYALVPVVILSSVHEEDYVRDAYRRGANTFTAKPFNLREWKSYVQYLRSYWFEMASTPKIWLDASAPTSTPN